MDDSSYDDASGSGDVSQTVLNVNYEVACMIQQGMEDHSEKVRMAE